MRSLQVIRRFVFEEWGGTETVVWNTSRELLRSGNPVKILSTKALCAEAQEIRNGIEIRRFNYFYPYLNLTKAKSAILDKKGGDPYSWSMQRYMEEAEDVDIIHCHTMNRVAASVRLAAKKRKIPYLVSFHGGHFDVPESEMKLMTAPYKNTFNYGRIIDLLTSKQRYLLDADAIICVGYNEYEITKEKYPDKLVYYLPNGVDYHKFAKKQDNGFREKYDIPQNSEVILCLSRIDYQKNQKLLVELLARLKDKMPDLHLLLVGPVTSESYFQQINTLIENENLRERVTIIKGLKADDPDLVKAYQTASVFILPSVHEPFGIVALEAFSSGVPVIAAAVGGLKRLIKDKETGLLFDGSIQDLVEKFSRLRNDQQLGDKLKKTASLEAREKYSWESVTHKLLDYYAEIKEKYGA